MSLSRKLSLVLALVLAIAVGASVALTLRTSRTYLEEVEQRLNRELADHLVAEEPLLHDGKVDPEALEHLFHMLMVINPRIELYVLDPTGRILAYEAPKGRVDLETVSLEPLQRFLAGEREPLHGDDPRDPLTPKIFSAAPMTSGSGELQGYLYVVLTGEQYRSLSDRFAESVALRVGIWAALAIALFVLCAGVAVLHFLTRPLERLDRRIAGFRSGQGEASPSGSGDEVARLDASFDELTARIAEQVEELEKTDQLRRELVANVSHDLRTPVASLQGYLETLLLKGDDVSASERTAYLEVAHAQSERLGRLVGELFELARLDSGDTAVILEDVSVAELSQDVVQKLEVLARNRQVALVARIDPETPPVSADVRLLERVLENLITNALQHTPAGGRVEVTVRQDESDGVRVTVEDSGCGIAEQDVPRIFDRTFRSEVSRSDGAGLGLAIAQRALELHSSQIDVSSTVGEGTTFSFGLPS